MPTIPIHNLGTLGLILDQEPHTLPPEAWSNVRNMRFFDGKISKVSGYAPIFGDPIVPPHFTAFVRSTSELFWVYAGLENIVAVTADVHTDITREDGESNPVPYNATVGTNWNATTLGGILIMNNGIDVPQYWGLSVANPMEDLDNWPSDLRARILRAYKGFLVGFNITKGGNTFPHRVKWSEPADPGTIPVSWDETDPTKLTGEFDISDTTAGLIREASVLGDGLIIYKDNSTWLMRFIGGLNVFRFDEILSDSGIMTSRCVTPVMRGEMHMVMNGTDIILFNGTKNVINLTDRRMRRFIQTDISTINFNNSFCVHNVRDKEAIFAYPSQDFVLPNRAVVWNYVDNTLTVRDIDAAYISRGFVEGGDDEDWDDDPQAWDLDPLPWAFFSKDRMIAVNPITEKILIFDQGQLADGQTINAFVERTGLAIVGQDRQGNPKVDFSTRKLIKRVWPKATGAPFNILVGAQETQGTPVVWSAPRLFTPGAQQFVDVTANGRLMAVRFESIGNDLFEIEGYDLEIEILGAH